MVEPELSLLSPASHLLQAVAMGCDQACTAITSISVPLLLEQYHNRSMVNGAIQTCSAYSLHVMQVSQRKALLQVLLEFVDIVRIFSQEDGIYSLLDVL